MRSLDPRAATFFALVLATTPGCSDEECEAAARAACAKACDECGRCGIGSTRDASFAQFDSEDACVESLLDSCSSEAFHDYADCENGTCDAEGGLGYRVGNDCPF